MEKFRRGYILRSFVRIPISMSCTADRTFIDHLNRYFLWIDIVALLTQLQAEVENVFYIINIILETSFYIADVWLLATILALAYALFSSRENGRVPRLVIAALLLPVALFISLTAVNVCEVVRRYENYGTQLSQPYDYLILVASRIEFAFDMILLAASVIILIGSVNGMQHARRNQRSIPVSFAPFADTASNAESNVRLLPDSSGLLFSHSSSADSLLLLSKLIFCLAKTLLCRSGSI